MKMTLCKVHLGMFQYCLDIPQLLNCSLMEQRPRRPGAPRAQCPPWCGRLGPGQAGSRPTRLLILMVFSRSLFGSSSRGGKPTSASVCVKENEQGAFSLGVSLQVQVLAIPSLCWAWSQVVNQRWNLSVP